MNKVEKDIPIPEKYFREKYYFKDMKIGDSFAIPWSNQLEAVRARCAASAYGQRNTGFQFTTRTVTEKNVKKLRIWRVEEDE
jgi:hypothetical protein|tara:strand:+ start:8284 stop:8529 length:246 start_codon:yes stop_codon:yes gene_type:complete